MSDSLAIIDREQDLMLSPIMDIATAKARLKTFQEFVSGYLVEGINGDFGTIPGTPKPTLLKPGADKLCELYGLADDYMVVPEYSREDWNRQPPLFDFTVRCILTSKRTGGHVSTGLGNCNSQEARYKWRDQKQVCPECGKESIFKDKQEGGGFYCWTKKGGCGKKFAANEVRIIAQVSGKVENEDVATLKNTILKMAKKRAKIDATLSATRSSGIFTQDMEDLNQAIDAEVVPNAPAAVRPAANNPPPAQPQRPQTPQAAAPASDDEPPFFDEAPAAFQEPSRSAARDNGAPLITEAQGKRFFAIAKGAGWTNDEIRNFLKQNYDIDHSREIKKSDYEKICADIQAGGSH